MAKIKKKLTKEEKLRLLNSFLCVLIGNLALAFGTAIFLTKLNIVAGGLSGIGIILQFHFAQYFGGQVIDIVVLILTWLLWVIGLIFVGKEFAIKTLASSLIYPLALSLFLRVPAFIQLSETICYYGITEFVDGVPTNVPIGNLLLCALFGGVFVGSGVGLCFLGGGSTGGVDVLIALIAKHTPIKESISSFFIDGTVIVLSMFLIKGNVVPSLCGILSAFVTALLIEFIYIGSQTSYQVDIISEKWEEISNYAQNELLRGATIIHAYGGYQGDERIILRIVFDKRQYRKIRSFIAQVDPKAFVTFTQTNAVFGEGFKTNKKSKI
ncbi:MAG: YitT family protein [Bacilli bacterium]|nr:YitT family protein [Bacilli bacterium]